MREESAKGARGPEEWQYEGDRRGEEGNTKAE
jgi:hypothetical protein